MFLTLSKMTLDVGQALLDNTIAPIIENQSVRFGDLTLEGAGAKILTNTGGAITSASIDSGDASSHWQISSTGLITPTATGVSAGLNLGPYSLGCTFTNSQGSDTATITVNIASDVYSVSDGELGAVVALGGATISGKTVEGRPNAEIVGTDVGSEVDFSTSLTLSSPLTIKSEDSNNLANLRRMKLRHIGHLILEDLTYGDEFIYASDTFFNTSVFRFTNNASGRSELTVRGCRGRTIGAGDTRTFDGSILISGTSAAHTSGVETTTLQLTNNPDLSSLVGGGLYSIRANTSVYRIDAVDNVAKTLTLNSVVSGGIAEVSAVDYTIGRTPPFLNGMAMDGGITNWPILTFTDNLVSQFNKGIVGTFHSYNIKRNWFEYQHQDDVLISVTGQEILADDLDNVYKGSQAAPNWALDPHADAGQRNLFNMVQANTVPYRFIGNRYWAHDARGNKQSVFLENYNVNEYGVLFEIKHNMTNDSATNAFTVENGAAGSVCRWNTACFDTDDPGGTDLTPSIRMDREDGEVDVAYNIAHGYIYNSSPLTSAAAHDNTTFASKSNANIGLILAGSDFSGSAWTTLADFTSDMLAQASGAADTADPKHGAGQYYTYDNGTAPTYSKSGLSDGLANEPASYSAVAMDSDGSGYGVDNSFSGAASSKTGLLSIWFYVDNASWPGSLTYMMQGRNSAGGQRLDLRTDASGRATFLCRDSSGSVVLSRSTNTSQFSPETWHHLLISWDLSASTVDFWVDDTEITSFASTVTVDAEIESLGRFSLFAQTSGGSVFDGFIAAPYLEIGNYLDLSVEANRRNFIDGDGKPVDPTLYSGTPDFLATNSVADFFDNLGSGGDLTETPADGVDEAASSPSD